MWCSLMEDMVSQEMQEFQRTRYKIRRFRDLFSPTVVAAEIRSGFKCVHR